MKDHKKKAKEILLSNRLDNYTIPSNNLYKHLWSWDSGWISFGLNIINEVDHAEKEMNYLFDHQWSNGLLPSIIFNLNEIDYFPGPNIWELDKYANKLTSKFNTTGIVQPPIHSYACLNIYRNSKNIKFLSNIYPKLLKWHNYLYQERDLHNDGIVYIRHPWESGMDNSPLWDDSLDKIKIDLFKYSKYRIDNKKVDSKERPTDLIYEKYIKLIEIFKECYFDEKLIFKKTKFAVQDVLFNVLLLKSNIALLNIAQILEKSNDYGLLSNWINKTENSINNKLFINDFYYDFDLISNKSIKIKTITGLSPIILSNKHKFQLIHILKNNFLDLPNNNFNIASIDRYSSNFNEINYWRGPTWVNLTWLILSGLKDNSPNLYKKIKDNITSKIENIGFFEYFNSNDINNDIKSGIGDNFFSWTASIYICLITNTHF